VSVYIFRSENTPYKKWLPAEIFLVKGSHAENPEVNFGSFARGGVEYEFYTVSLTPVVRYGETTSGW
jgi:hypothetical protein